jgi:hypothetical protein
MKDMIRRIIGGSSLESIGVPELLEHPQSSSFTTTCPYFKIFQTNYSLARSDSTLVSPIQSMPDTDLHNFGYRQQQLFSTDGSIDQLQALTSTDFEPPTSELNITLDGLNLDTLKRQAPPQLDTSPDLVHMVKTDAFLGASAPSAYSGFEQAQDTPLTPLSFFKRNFKLEILPDTPVMEVSEHYSHQPETWESSREWQDVQKQLLQLQQLQFLQMQQQMQMMSNQAYPFLPMEPLPDNPVEWVAPFIYRQELREELQQPPIPVRSSSLSPHLSPQVSPSLNGLNVTSIQENRQRSLSAISDTSYASNANDTQTLDRMGKHQCSYCGKQFTRKYNLQGHIRAHKGERPYDCSVCATAFTRKADLERHKKIHGKGDPPSSTRSRTVSRATLDRGFGGHSRRGSVDSDVQSEHGHCDTL